jgi:VanZ family protein
MGALVSPSYKVEAITLHTFCKSLIKNRLQCYMKTLKLNKKHFKLLFFVTAIAVFILATVGNDHIDINHQYADKIKHITAFFTLSLLLNRSSSTLQHHLRNIIALLFFGFLIELAQYFIPSRESDLMDILADFIGILLFQVTYFFLKAIQYFSKRAEVKTKRL